MVKKNSIAYKQRQSRKWNLVLLVFWFATLLVLLPPLISVWLFGALTPVVIISGTEYVSLITLIVSAYFAGNVWEKHVEMRNNYGMYRYPQGYETQDYETQDYVPIGSSIPANEEGEV